MHKLKRALALGALATAATGSLLVGTAGPAAADTPATTTIRIDGRFDLVDDDWDYDPTEYEYFSKTVTIAKDTTQTVIIKSRVCAGGEVRAELRLSASYYSNGHLFVDGSYDGLRLYEGTSCSTTDLDGISHIYGPGQLSLNKSAHSYTYAGNYDEGGDDRATVQFDTTRIS